jgi:general secretion pathway protein C
MIRVDGNRIVDALALAIIVSVALVAAPVTWRVLGRDDGRRAVSAAVAAPVAPPIDLGPLKHFAPFGHLASVVGVTGDPTALGLQLRGVLLARPAAASIALISAANGPAKGFGVGATLPGGAILDAVEFDLVVLRVNGQIETLALSVKPGAATPPTAGAPPPVGVAIAVGPIEQYRARVQDPLTLLGSLGATAGPDGYRIGASPSDDLRRAGLQPGDIVEKVNGEAVGDPVHDRKLFNDAVVAGRIRVDVIRDGKHLALSFPLH